MKILLMLLSVSLLFTCGVAFAAGKVETPKSCQQCGMDREYFSYSRMLIVYADGTESEPVTLPDADVSNLPGLWRRLPDNFYRVYQVQENGTLRLVTQGYVQGGLLVDPNDKLNDSRKGLAGYYRYKHRPIAPRTMRREWLTGLIREVHVASRQTYGSRRVVSMSTRNSRRRWVCRSANAWWRC